MEQTYENRGKLAFIADHVEIAITAFVNNDFATVTRVLEELGSFIPEFLREANAKRQ